MTSRTIVLRNNSAKDVLCVEHISLNLVEETTCSFMILYVHFGCYFSSCLLCFKWDKVFLLGF